MASNPGSPSSRPVRGEEHKLTHKGELVVEPFALESFLERSDLPPTKHEYGHRDVSIEVRAATTDQDPPNGALWLTAVDADVSLKADPAEVLRVLHEAGILRRLKAEGELPFL